MGTTNWKTGYGGGGLSLVKRHVIWMGRDERAANLSFEPHLRYARTTRRM